MRLRLSRTDIVVMCLSATALVSAAGLGAADPFAGSWKMNLAKSKLDANHHPASATMRFEPTAKGYSLTVEGTHEWGDKVSNTVELILDGKDHPAPEKVPDLMTAMTRPKPNLIEILVKQSGRVMSRNTLDVSANGKTLTSTIYARKDDKEMPVVSVGVFERQ